MRLPARRKLVMVLALLATMGFFFLSFQLFSVHLLSQEHRRSSFFWGSSSSRRRKNGALPYGGVGGGAINSLLSNGHDKDPEQMRHLQNQFLDKYLEELQREEGYGEMPAIPSSDPTGIDTWWSPQFMGVAPHRLGVYQAALDSGVFACFSEPGRRLAFSQVNDDYCDCELDGSDEPGTEACSAVFTPLRRPPHPPHSPSDDGTFSASSTVSARFFCRFQLPGAADSLAAALDSANKDAFDYEADSLQTIPLQWTVHSRVNDGICDCCDGSDEWRNSSTLTITSALSSSSSSSSRSSKHSHVKSRVPCANTCTAVRVSFKERLIAQKEGKSLKQKYILEAKRHFSPLYGEESEFYLLSIKCFQRHTGEYQYTVCPFRQVQQKHKQQLTGLNLGRKPAWYDLSKKILLMTDGSDQLCPGRQKRKSFINFRCAVQEAIVSSMETDVCVYTFEITTPAAC